jgi:hypothetical protein
VQIDGRRSSLLSAGAHARNNSLAAETLSRANATR